MIDSDWARCSCYPSLLKRSDVEYDERFVWDYSAASRLVIGNRL